MTKIYNKTDFVNYRKQLRNNMAKAEIVLWSKLKSKQLGGLKFRRQYSVNNYIIDFYCPELKLGIELDGPTHEFSLEADKKRQYYIESIGIKILRFNNNDIYCRLNEVLEKIIDCKTMA